MGWLFGRRRLNLVSADALYWLFLGIPLGYVCFHLISQLSTANTLFLLTKQAMNGIANALLARLIFSFFSSRSEAFHLSFREMFANLLAFFVLGTALVFLVVSGRTYLAETDHQIRQSLIQDSLRVTDSLGDWEENRKAPILRLAGLASTRSPARMQMHLEQVRTTDTHFLRIALLDDKARIVAIAPLRDASGGINIGKCFADRPYIPTLQRTLKPMLSEVVKARIGPPEPVVAMLVPVVQDGRYGGYVSGILNFERIRAILEIHAGDRDLWYTLVDRNGNVIVSNRGDQEAMKPFSRIRGSLTAPDEEGIARWIPELPANASTIDLWGESLYVRESPIGKLAEWKLILEQPVAPFQKRLYKNYTGKLILVFLVLFASLALAEFLSRRMVRTLQQLAGITRGLPSRLASESRIAWPRSSMSEIFELTNNIKEMADSLVERFVDIRRINASLEQRIEERTEELRKSEAFLDSIVENVPAMIFLKDAKDLRFVKFNRAGAELLGYTREDLLGKNDYDFFPRQEADFFTAKDKETIRLGNLIEILEETIQTRHLGERILHTRKITLRDKEGNPRYLLGISMDITERKKAEEEIRRLNEDLEQRVRERTRELRDAQTALLNLVDDLNESTRSLTEANLALEVANRELETFSYSVSHDLRAPLRHLLGFVEILKEEMPLPRDENISHYLKVISDSATKMRRLIEDILSFSRMSRAELSKTRVRLDELLKEAIAQIAPDTEGRDVVWKTGPLPEVQGDTAMLRQVLVNLLANAVKFTGLKPQAVIEVGCDTTHEGEYVFFVRDNGAGFDMKYSGKLFSLFQRLHRSDEFEGTGAGLAHVRHIIQRHGGRTWAEGTVGDGAVFYFALPKETLDKGRPSML